ncbi:hypothetical protein H6P81_011258 [Aristolochia fimbriata]|uniref:Secreted protein n=1 Tax=Aristolochia fimbriata TaxID=158543 RepID=A0AAV7EVH2_ARIFI|nr:hypothetical protein H6P81_011258 [Aristolochia fimbriata]
MAHWLPPFLFLSLSLSLSLSPLKTTLASCKDKTTEQKYCSSKRAMIELKFYVEARNDRSKVLCRSTYR